MRHHRHCLSVLSVLLVWTLAGVASAQRAPRGEAPVGATLSVTTDPPGALVQVDREARGNSPLEVTGLAPGRHLVRVTLRDHREAVETVQLDAGARLPLDLRLEPLRATVLVHSEPVGASVSLDGAHRGVTPLLLPAVELGKHRVAITRPGYQEKVVELEVSGPTPQKIEAQLLTDSATLRVESTPAGADVSLNGVPRGQTPLVLERIPDGDSEVEVRAEGYAPFRQSIRLAAGDDEKLAIALTPLPGTLQVVSMPEGARVYVDNQYRGDTPFTLAELAPGNYRVRVELAAHDPMARDVTVGRAANLVEEFRLVPNCGALRVVTAPAGVAVLVDGKLRGETVAKPGASDQVSEPLTVGLVPVGKREVVFSRQGYHEQRESVDVDRDKTVTLDVTLKRRFIPDYEVRTASNVYRGVLVNITPEVVRLETEIGVIRAFPTKDIKSRRPLREDERMEVVEPTGGVEKGPDGAGATQSGRPAGEP